MKLSLIIPCYNEEKNVSRFYEAVNFAFLGKIDDYEFVFVDDGSKDATYKELKALYDTHTESNIQVISFSRNFGKEAAMYAGLSNAHGEYVCIIDADLQQKPEIVVQMMDRITADEETDCVCSYQQNRKESKMVSAAKSAFYKMMNKMSDTEFVNGASDFRLMRRTMVDAILQMTEYHRFSKGLFSWVGFKTEYIPYDVDERIYGESKFGLRKLTKYAIDGIISFSTIPLKFATFIGLLSSAGSIIYLIAVVIEKLCFGIETKGYATIVVLILLIGGLQLFSIGILGEYMSKIYIQSKDRPIYIVKKHLGENDEQK